MLSGSSRAWMSDVMRSCRRRFSSASGNVGRSATSAMTGNASGRRSTGTFRLIAEASKELVVLIAAPTNSMASAISSADRLPAPSSSIAAVRLESPNFPAGSSPPPTKTTRLICTTGTSCVSTTQTGNPLESMRFWIAGRSRLGGGASAGGFARSGRCCAASDAEAMTAQRTVTLPIIDVAPAPRAAPRGDRRAASGRRRPARQSATATYSVRGLPQSSRDCRQPCNRR